MTYPLTIVLADDNGVSGNDSITSDPTLTGMAAPDTVVTILNGTTALGTTTADASGNWSFTPTTLTNGDHTLTASVLGGDATAPLSFTLKSELLFTGQGASGQAGLWVSDGTAGGTSEITGIQGVNATYGLNASEFTPLGGKALFEGEDNNYQYNLWITDGTAAGTSEITGIQGASTDYGLNPSDLTTFDGKVLFAGEDASDKQGLWVTDGTTAGTSEITGIQNAGTIDGLSPSFFTASGGKVLFRGEDASDQLGLWVTDGTAAGTSEITGIQNAYQYGVNPFGLTTFDGKVLFEGTDASDKAGLWVTDGTAAGTSEITGIQGASTDYGVNPFDLTPFDGKVLFEGYDASDKHGLWVTDGTAAGTSEITGIQNVGQYGLEPNDLTAYGDKALFQGTDASGNTGIWVTDGTAAGTSELTGLQGGSFTVYDGKVLFDGTEGGSNQGLWVTDGTAAGTSEITGIQNVGTGGLNPHNFAAVNLHPAPTITALQATADATGPLNAGHVVTFTLTPSDSVVLDTKLGSPTLTLSDGASATYDAADSTATSLVFTGTVAAGDNTTDLTVTGLALNGATVTDNYGVALNTAGLAQLTGSDTGLVIDTTAPVVTAALAHDTGFTNLDFVTSDPTLTGSGDANATVILSEGTTTLGTTTADGSGSWSFTPTLDDGLHTIIASETDVAGNVGTATAGFRLDTTAPAVTAALVHDTGVSASDGITVNPALAGSGDPDAVVTIRDGATTIGTTTADDSGNWSFTPTGLTNSVHTLTASETDAAGNTGTATAAITFDTTAPAVTAVLANDTGASASDGLTNNPALTGSAEPNSMVTVLDGDAVLGTAATDGLGHWRFTPTGLEDGVHTLTVEQTDAAGNVGSITATFTLDATAPAAPEVLGLSISGSGSFQPGNAVTDTRTPDITGTGVAGDTITLMAGSQSEGTATVSGDGTWRATLSSPLAQGVNTLTATAKDAAGNVSAASTPLQVTVIAAPDPSGVTSADMTSAELMQSGNTLQFTPDTQEVILADGTLSLSPQTDIAFVARLYEGMLGRAPDAAGLGFWSAQLAAGASRSMVAAGFLSSTEYGSDNGGPVDNTQFVTSLYENEMGRAPDQAGLAYWTGALQSGSVTQGAVLADFAASPEAEQHWSSLTTQLWAPDPNAGLVRGVYEAGLGRDADAGGLTYWSAQLNAGLTPQDFAQDIVGSAEFQSLHGAQTDGQFVASLYQDVLGRAPDQAGGAYWTNALQSGAVSRAGAVLDFAQSPEAQALLTHART